MNRRSFVGLCGTTLVTSVAGCSALGTVTDSVEGTRTLELTQSELSNAEFQTFVANSHNRHGSGGVWGQQGEPPQGLEFEGAWTGTFSHGKGVTSRHLLATYQLPPGPEGLDSSQVWLWSGVEPTDRMAVHRIETGISLQSNAELGIYSPAQSFDAGDVDDYRVESGRLDVSTAEIQMPLSNGRIDLDRETQVGSGGAYAPFWEGESQSQQSLAATTEVRWEDRQDAKLEWESSVETSD